MFISNHLVPNINNKNIVKTIKNMNRYKLIYYIFLCKRNICDHGLSATIMFYNSKRMVL